jgi:glutathione S-transferase
MRARLALQAGGIDVELRDIELKSKPAKMLSVSPKGTVPVLVLLDGKVIEQSLDIMLWALRQSDPQGWLPRDDFTLQDALTRIATNDGHFKQALDRYKYPARYALADGMAHRDQGAQTLMALELRLSSLPYFNGAHWGFLDAAIAPFVRQFAHVDKAWFAARDWPHLNRWLEAFEASAAFAAVMKKVPVWHAGDAPRNTRFAAGLAPAAPV